MEEKGRNKIIFLLGLVVLAGGFVLFISLIWRRPQAVEADLSSLQVALREQGLDEATQPGTDQLLKRRFELLPSAYEDLFYLAPETFMDVEELLVIRTGAADQAPIRQAMEKHLESLKNSFENYGTDQYSVLQQALIYQNDQYICYVAGHRAGEMMELVRRMIER